MQKAIKNSQGNFKKVKKKVGRIILCMKTNDKAILIRSV